MPVDKKSGFVTLVGRPNVGKSTLMNCLIGQKIAITSAKPQTTRNRIRTVFTDARGQIVFVDTPGMHKAKNKLGDYMMETVVRSIRDVDLICWLVEIERKPGKAEEKIVETLKDKGIPVILVINKIDGHRPAAVMESIAAYQNLMPFDSVVPVSAMEGSNTEELLSEIFRLLPAGPMYYDPETLTDQPERQIAAEIIREKALHALEEEIPHGIAVTIEKMSVRPGKKLMEIEASIICEKDSHKGIIIGKGGQMLKTIGSRARFELEKMLQMQVILHLWVKVRKDWRDSELMLKNFGYDKKRID